MNPNENFNNKKFRHTLRDDIRSINLKKDILKEYQNLNDFYLSSEKRSELEKMNSIQKWVHQLGWLLKSAFMHLSPLRRILVLIGVLLFSFGVSFKNNDLTIYSNDGLAGGILILFVLFLELKDKLLAKNELEAGRRIQRALMPEQNPEIAGCTAWLYTQPANEVGGDLVDYLQIQEHQVVFTLADIAGKGLQAALLTSKLQSTVRALATDICSLSALGGKINKIFYRDSLPNLFASMILMRFDSNTGKVDYINAGHYSPIIIKEGVLQEFSKGEAAIGILPNAEYLERTIQLGTDDFLIVYSDGVLDAQNESGEFFGKERFFELLSNSIGLSPKQLGDYLISRIKLFIGDHTAADDISLIIMKRDT